MARTAKPWFWEARDAWYVNLRGQRHLLARGRKSKREAVAAFHRLMIEGGQGGPSSAVLTAAEVCDLFLGDVHHRLGDGEIVAVTAEWYVRHLQSFAEHCGHVAAEAVRPLHVAAWLSSHPWSQGSRHGAAAAVKAAFRWAHRQGYLETDLLVNLKRPGAERREAVMTGEQLRQILAGTRDEAWRDLLVVLWETGARPGEIRKTTVLELDLARKRIVLPAHQSKTGRKTGQPRVIYLTAVAQEIIVRLAARHPEGPIFRNLKGNPWTRNAMSCRFARIRRKHGFGGEATAYALRHKFATDALESGVPIATVSELLGHRDTTMISRVYSHLHECSDHLSEAADKVRPGGPS